jgi:DNA mismatch endonuclease, patch repair protein
MIRQTDGMVDTRTKVDRRRIMAAVRQRDTMPEMELRRALFSAGIRGWRCNYGRVPGRPDIAWPSMRVALFVDGAFWHGHPSRHRPGRSGKYWDVKIAGNVARDRRVDGELRMAGWEVIRIWDFEIYRSMDKVVEEVILTLASRITDQTNLSNWKQRLVR